MSNEERPWNGGECPAVPEGWKLVPVEPTVEMVERGAREVDWYEHNARDCYEVMLAAAPEPAEQHPDDAAVDRFAQAMKAKLAQARAKGRSGWDDPAQCSPEYLADLLAGHVRKGNDGNFVDVANFAMMLHQRGAAPSVMPDAIRRSAAEESLTTEQPSPGPVAWLAEGTRQDTGDVVHGPPYDDPDSAERYANIMRRAGLVDVSVQALYPASLKAERDALRAENAQLRERVKELEADAARWHFVRQFMCLDDVGDEDFCLGLITYGESLSERVDPAASRLYKDRWDARCRAEYQGEELDQGGITVDEAIDAAMREGE